MRAKLLPKIVVVILLWCVRPFSLPESRCEDVVWGPFVSRQISADSNGNNVIGDEANTPSIAIDPHNPNRIVIGWRDIFAGEPETCSTPCLRRNAFAYSNDGGNTWSSTSVIEPEEDRTLPVLAADGLGNFYYHSLRIGGTWLPYFSSIYGSADGGATWDLNSIVSPGEFYLEPWLVASKDTSNSRLYLAHADGIQESNDGGLTFQLHEVESNIRLAAIDVGPTGIVWAASRTGRVFTFRDGVIDEVHPLETCHPIVSSNEGALFNGRIWIIADPQFANTAYVLVPTYFAGLQRDIEFLRTDDGGASWSHPYRVNDDPIDFCSQWLPEIPCRWSNFGMISASPSGRIDVVWRGYDRPQSSWLVALRYAYSLDRGRSWSSSIQLTPAFSQHVFSCSFNCGSPGGSSIGPHYYDHMHSGDDAVHIAYSASFFDSVNPGVFDSDVFYLNVSAQMPDWDGDGITNNIDVDDDNDGVIDEWDSCDFSRVGIPVDQEGNGLGDHNDDCCTDFIDFLHFPACLNLSGPGDVVFPALCRERYDLDMDFDEDLFDYRVFQLAFDPSGCGPLANCD